MKPQDGDPPWKKNWAIKSVDGLSRIHKGIMCAHVTSSLSRIVMTDALQVISKRYKVALTCYDEVVLHVREEEAEEARVFAEMAMSQAPWWLPNLPVACEAHISPIYNK